MIRIPRPTAQNRNEIKHLEAYTKNSNEIKHLYIKGAAKSLIYKDFLQPVDFKGVFCSVLMHQW